MSEHTKQRGFTFKSFVGLMNLIGFILINVAAYRVSITLGLLCTGTTLLVLGMLAEANSKEKL